MAAADPPRTPSPAVICRRHHVLKEEKLLANGLCRTSREPPLREVPSLEAESSHDLRVNLDVGLLSEAPRYDHALNEFLKHPFALEQRLVEDAEVDEGLVRFFSEK